MKIKRRKNKGPFLYLFCFSLFWLILTGAPADVFKHTACADEIEQGLVGILISQEIRPFVMMVEGFEESSSYSSCRIFLDKDGIPYSQDPRCKDLSSENYSLIVAVGPNALKYLKDVHWPGKIVYGMILNPERMFSPTDENCGVSLNIPPEKQFSDIKKILPGVSNLSILFSPEHNGDWFSEAVQRNNIPGLTVTPLAVNERSDIPQIFKGKKMDTDAVLFIPDKTVISKPIINYVIKESIKKRIPTIGFNYYFHESGSAMSFVIDYKKIGEQVAEKVENLLEKGDCESSGPNYHIYVNGNVLRTLDMETATPLPDNVVTE